MEKDFVSFIQLTMGTISFLVAIIFTYYNWRKGAFGILISIMLFLSTYGVNVNTLAATGIMINFPHTFRTGLLVLYITPALIYFGLRIGFAKVPFGMLDLFHLIPVISYLINFSPSIFTSAAVKRELINPENMRSFQDGIIFAPYVVLWLSEVLILFYIAKIYREFILHPNPHITPNHQTIAKILMTFLAINMMQPLFGILRYCDGQYRVSFLMVYVISSIGFYFALLNRPKVIYGSIKNIPLDNQLENIPFITAEPLNPGIGQDLEINTSDYKEINGLSPALYATDQPINIMTPEWKKIEKFLEESMAFLNALFSQQDLIHATGLSAFQIRTVLKATGKVNFPNYINEKRINYLLKMLKEDEKWKYYNIAALANQSGFKSINSFYLSFKKVTGVTPKEYIERVYIKD